MNAEALQQLIDQLELAPHPEGGWFKRIYSSQRMIETEHGSRHCATSIHYLLGGDQRRGRLHRNRSEILHFLLDGGPVSYFLLDAEDALSEVPLSLEGQRHLLVPGGCWKASALADGVSHALVVELVVPGFDYADHEFADAGRLAGSRHLQTLRDFLR